MEKRPVCFAIMPFTAELNYFYLYLQKHTDEVHGIELRRGDTAVLTRELIVKIRDEIRAADLVLADVTGLNPNVFYEIGLAHGIDKKVLFLTQSDPAQVPVDIRQFEFIKYDLGKHKEFLEALDNALGNFFVERYSSLYERAIVLLNQFNQATGVKNEAVILDEFRARVIRGERLELVPSYEDADAFANFMLPKIVRNNTDLATIKSIAGWLTSNFPSA